jgi:AcrR family transcriptional regulator
VARTASLARAPLDRAALVRAGAGVADRDGWSNLTLSEVAKSVDRHITSLYAHVDGLDALRRQIALLAVDELGELLWAAALGRTGADALRTIATVERDYARRHPGRLTAMTTGVRGADPEFAAKAKRMSEPLRATLRSFGLAEDRIPRAHSAFSCALRGLVLAETTDSVPSGNGDATFEALLDLFISGLESGTWL